MNFLTKKTDELPACHKADKIKYIKVRQQLKWNQTNPRFTLHSPTTLQGVSHLSALNLDYSEKHKQWNANYNIEYSEIIIHKKYEDITTHILISWNLMQYAFIYVLKCP